MKAGFVSFIGRPNAGKSTLMNRLVGTKLAIVSDKPQTTRTRILGVQNYPGAQVVFLDTPGIHRPLHRMNVRMVDAAIDTIREVDVLGLVVDASEPPGKGDQFVLDLVKGARSRSSCCSTRSIWSANRSCCRSSIAYAQMDCLPRSSRFRPRPARTSTACEQALIDRLPEGEPLYPADYLTDQPERFFAAEMVREKLLQLTHAEIPFSSAVVVDRFEEPDRPKELLRIHCTILVDRESQKPIVVGRGGDMIKRIGTAAREELERFFATRVFLDLHVRVKTEWREDDRVLHDIGVMRSEAARVAANGATQGRSSFRL